MKPFIKLELRFVPLLIVLLGCQWILGQAASYALTDREPELKVILRNESGADIAENFEDQLSDAGLIAEESDGKVMGTLLIPKDFEKEMQIFFYPAQGITHTTVIKEQLATELLRLRLTNENNIDLNNEKEAVVLHYNNGAEIPQAVESPPVYKTSALLMLSAFLNAAVIAPGRDKRRFAQKGRKYALKAVYAWLAVFLFYAVTVGLYFIGLKFLYGIEASDAVIFGFLLTAAYAALLGTLLAFFGGRRFAVYIFIPWLIFNMTFGGGLWNTDVSPNLFPVLPIAILTQK